MLRSSPLGSLPKADAGFTCLHTIWHTLTLCLPMAARNTKLDDMPSIPSAIRIADSLTALSVVLMLAMISLAWPGLPEEVPIHFNASGLPGKYSHRITLFLLPGVTALAAGFTKLLAGQPNLMNYPVKVTPENQGPLYRESLLLASSIIALTALLMLALTAEILQVARQASTSASLSAVWLYLLLITGAVFWSYRRMLRYQQ